jgi:hypothetical protein
MACTVSSRPSKTWDADLEGNAGPKAYREAFEHLCDPARDLVGMIVEPVRQ